MHGVIVINPHAIVLFCSLAFASNKTVNPFEIEPHTWAPNISVEPKQWTVDEWMESAHEDHQKGKCYKEIVKQFPLCNYVDTMLYTVGWQKSHQHYRTLVDCRLHPGLAFVSTHIDHKSDIAHRGTFACEDDTRTWVKLPPETP